MNKASGSRIADLRTRRVHARERLLLRITASAANGESSGSPGATLRLVSVFDEAGNKVFSPQVYYRHGLCASGLASNDQWTARRRLPERKSNDEFT